MKKILLGMALLLFSLSSHAALITYDLVYTSGGAATGSGFVTIDDAVFPNIAPGAGGPPSGVPAATFGITAFSITITGASAGNGTFTLADFDGFAWLQSAPYDLTTELVAQAAHDDFNMFSSGGAPNGSSTGNITTNSGGAGDVLTLGSITPRVVIPPGPAAESIPTLSFWGLSLLVLLLPFIARRRIKL